jgi:hypothetical protein
MGRLADSENDALYRVFACGGMRLVCETRLEIGRKSWLRLSKLADEARDDYGLEEWMKNQRRRWVWVWFVVDDGREKSLAGRKGRLRQTFALSQFESQLIT